MNHLEELEEMMSTTSWTCDVCEGLIENAKDGYVEWLHFGNGSFSEMRIVHHPRNKQGRSCQFNSRTFPDPNTTICDQDLNSFIGHDGLMLLLSMITEEEVPARSIIEIIMRIHLPGYEIARGHMNKAILEGIVMPNLPKGFFWQEDIRLVIEHYAEK